MKQNWIDVYTTLPSKDGRYMVTVKGKDGKAHTEMSNFRRDAKSNKWDWENVTAWQPRPKPYERKID